MISFDYLFPDVARDEVRVIHAIDDPVLPKGTFLLVELYCEEPGCDCRRVLLSVYWAERKQPVATINYAFEPPKPPFEDEGQVFLDPLNPQSQYSPRFIELFEEMIATDQDYRQRLIRHYGLWKSVVDDPLHPDHAKIERTWADMGPGRIAPIRRTSPKPVSGNAPCPCGSGRRYKKCCKVIARTSPESPS